METSDSVIQYLTDKKRTQQKSFAPGININATTTKCQYLPSIRCGSVEGDYYGECSLDTNLPDGIGVLVNDENFFLHDFKQGQFSGGRTLHVNRKTNNWEVIENSKVDEDCREYSRATHFFNNGTQ